MKCTGREGLKKQEVGDELTRFCPMLCFIQKPVICFALQMYQQQTCQPCKYEIGRTLLKTLI